MKRRRVMALAGVATVAAAASAHSQKVPRVGILFTADPEPVLTMFRKAMADSYGADQGEIYRGVAGYVDRILKGAKPADLPVVQAAKVELVVNQKTARMLGVVFPPMLLARVDEVIE